MGLRKKHNLFRKIRQAKEKVRRDKNRIKRMAKAKTAGQKLHDLMHGKS